MQIELGVQRDHTIQFADVPVTVNERTGATTPPTPLAFVVTVDGRATTMQIQRKMEMKLRKGFVRKSETCAASTVSIVTVGVIVYPTTVDETEIPYLLGQWRD